MSPALTPHQIIHSDKEILHYVAAPRDGEVPMNVPILPSTLRNYEELKERSKVWYRDAVRMNRLIHSLRMRAANTEKNTAEVTAELLIEVYDQVSDYPIV